jgi:outer membrane protein assembly factor BamB
VSPRADRLFVIDALCDEATLGHCWLETVALDAATGRVRWTARRAHGAGSGLVVGPSGGRVFVGGWVADDYSAFLGMLVVAYRA